MSTRPVNPTNKPRWFQFSLRSLGTVIFVLCVGLAWLAYERNQVRKRIEAIRAIEKLGGTVDFDQKQPFRPVWIRSLLGDTTPGEVVSVGLEGTQTTDGDLVCLNGLTKLEYLSLISTQITDSGLAQLRDLSKLVSLDLANTQITDNGLGHLSGLTELTIVYMDFTRISDVGLAKLAGLTKLETIHIGHTKVTKSGANKLKKALPSIRVEP